MCSRKQHKNSFNKDTRSKTKSTLEIVYSYMCGLLQVDSLGGNKFFVTFINDYILKLWAYLINKKSGLIDVFTKFKEMVERQSGHKIKVMRTNGGREYVSKDFDTL